MLDNKRQGRATNVKAHLLGELTLHNLEGDAGINVKPTKNKMYYGPKEITRDGAEVSVWVMGIWVCMLSECSHLHMLPLHCAINHDTGRYVH